jgi:hypothetical protein
MIISLILRTEKEALYRFEFKMLEPDMTLIVPFFFGVMNNCDWYPEAT